VTNKQPRREGRGKNKPVSNKQKRTALEAKRLRRKRKVLRTKRAQSPDKQLAAYDTGFPPGAIAANLKAQAPNSSYAVAKLYYVDEPFDWVDCGKHAVWTASQQQWYFEVAKRPIYGRAIRCRPCRARRRGDLRAEIKRPMQDRPA
jgi:hypothetical protein